MDALRNSHIPFGDEWIPTGYGGLVRRSAIISARPVKLTAEGEREHHPAARTERAERALGRRWKDALRHEDHGHPREVERFVVLELVRALLAELDAIAPNNPVYLTAKSLHAAWANTKAMQMANITSQTSDPHNGQIQHDAKDNPTGILLETAMELVGNLVPEPTITEIANAIEKAQPILWKMGLTGVHDFDRRDSFMAPESVWL
jgi:predicted amidohydrolase YtcJ